ncbi:HyaD/HybD family hydrogenase maturation endopeptidase [Aeromonas bestiarum]|uniref:HyaD/HybD family hydrogenase maturation endopeptidase n=1 Tax=Aeromonas bestiarum TaxID=105751 RepID=UPI0036708BD1
MNTLILGVGNLLLSDEAVGVRLVEGLGREYRFAPGIELLDGGTAGMELLEAMASRDHIILADAVRSGNPPGTVVTLQGEEIPTLFGRKISPHQLGLADVLSALHMTGESPKRLTLIGIEPESLEPRIGLTPRVAAAMGEAKDRILTLLASVGAPAIALSEQEKAKQEQEGLWRSPI